eukprot:SAG31_NODE_696_length_12754_cov_9.480759_5_plen_84_part_00
MRELQPSRPGLWGHVVHVAFEQRAEACKTKQKKSSTYGQLRIIFPDLALLRGSLSGSGHSRGTSEDLGGWTCVRAAQDLVPEF